MKTMTSLTLLVGGVLAIGGCTHHAKPVSSTTTHTDTTTESNTGDKKTVNTTETSTLQPDGTETTNTTVSTQQSTPPPLPVSTPSK